MKTIQIIGRKNSGKTTFVCELIRFLKVKFNKRVVSFKHSSEMYPVDKPNTDSSKHREAGADVSIFNTDKETGLYFNNINSAITHKKLNNFLSENVDYKIIESKRTRKGSKFEIVRDFGSLNDSYYTTDKDLKKSIIGIISDDDKVFEHIKEIPVFKKSEIDKLITFSDNRQNTPKILKNDLRKKIKKVKNRYSIHDRNLKSEYILNQVEKSDNFISAKTIFVYWAMDDEVNTRNHTLKWKNQGKKIILPSVDGDNLVLKEFTGEDSLISGENFGIAEPDGKIFTNYKEIDLAIIPGIAFDNNLNRMGRGRGYYDKILKLLNSKNNCFLLGICFDFQIVDNVPIEEHDIKMSNIIFG